ncbi:hypothetical protein [Paucihalobacter sp.]
MKKLLFSVVALVFATVLLTIDDSDTVNDKELQDAVAQIENFKKS